MLSLEAIKFRGLEVHSVIYNHIHDDAAQTDVEIANSTIDFLKNYLAQHYPMAHWLALSVQEHDGSGNVDFILPENFI